MKNKPIEDQKFQLTKIVNNLQKIGMISFEEYNKFLEIKENFDEEKKSDGKESNLQYLLHSEKESFLIDEIKSLLKDKKEFEFISDYFINEITKDKLYKNSNKLNLTNLKNKDINDTFITNLNKLNTDYSLGDNFDKIYSLFSKNFLSFKLNFMEDQIKILKESDNLYITDQSLKENYEIKNMFDSKAKNNKDYIDIIKNINKKGSSNSVKESATINKEIEEEINNQIFRYTKSMKENAKNIGEQLKEDNKTLNRIEEIQTKDKIKTDIQVKRLTNFNYSLKLGFFKIILMFILVFVTFIFMVLFMRIFPKLA